MFLLSVNVTNARFFVIWELRLHFYIEKWVSLIWNYYYYHLCTAFKVFPFDLFGSIQRKKMKFAVIREDSRYKLSQFFINYSLGTKVLKLVINENSRTHVRQHSIL